MFCMHVAQFQWEYLFMWWPCFVEVWRLTKYFKWMSTVHRNTQGSLFVKVGRTRKWEVSRCWRHAVNEKVVLGRYRYFLLVTSKQILAVTNFEWFDLLQLIEEVNSVPEWLDLLQLHDVSVHTFRIVADMSLWIMSRQTEQASFAVTKEFSYFDWSKEVIWNVVTTCCSRLIVRCACRGAIILVSFDFYICMSRTYKQ